MPATDDLGAAVPVTGVARRVVSLVPSLTETLAEARPDAVVGATDWCTHPAGLDVVRVRGTKNPDTRAIARLAPDLVIANQEENREIDVRRLREAGVPVWVTRIETVPEAVGSIERLFDEGLRWPRPGWLGVARERWCGAPEPPRARVAVAVWRDPWMFVGARTFAGDLLRRLGYVNVLDDHSGRYPALSVPDVEAMAPDLVLLPDEPYGFTADDGPESFRVPTVLVSGRLLTWYGPSLIDAGELIRL